MPASELLINSQKSLPLSRGRAREGVINTTTLTDDPVGFAAFYRLLFRRELARHAFAWVRAIYAAHTGDVPPSAEPSRNSNANSVNLPFSPDATKRCSQGKGLVIEAFRGSSKTSTIAVAFLAFRIGLSPHDSFLLLGANAAAARATCRQVADLIEHNEGWRIAFPHVVPDKKAGWSMANGYEVKRDDMDYSAWRQLCAETKGRDPSFIGLGYRSSFIVGLHPTGMLLADDIHNETNTRSVKEMDKAVAIITSNILPTLNPASWKIFIGTPWRQGDVLQYLKATETYASVSTPVYTELESPPPEPNQLSSQAPLSTSGGEGPGVRWKAGQSVAALASDFPSDIGHLDIGHPDVGRGPDIILTWPERFPLPVIENYRQMLGEREFARMYLLDLSAAEGIHLKAEWLQKVDSANIQPAWPVVMGVDYASTADKQRDNDRDYFAVAIGRAQPSGSGIILIDGYRGHLSQAEAQDKLLELVAFYPNTEVIGIESVGKGEEFYHSLSSHPSLPIVQMNPGGQGKGPRFQNAMAPLFERGWARITDAESPFLQAFRREWLRWPWGDHDDTLDAAYWMLRAGQYHLPRAHPNPNPPAPSPISGGNNDDYNHLLHARVIHQSEPLQR